MQMDSQLFGEQASPTCDFTCWPFVQHPTAFHRDESQPLPFFFADVLRWKSVHDPYCTSQISACSFTGVHRRMLACVDHALFTQPEGSAHVSLA